MINLVKIRILLVSILFTHLIGCSAEPTPFSLDKIELPSGFKIEVFAQDVPNARAMVLGDKGTLFVGSRRAGKVYAIVEDKTKAIKKVMTIASGLNLPTGLTFKDGALYVSEVSRIIRYDNIEQFLENPPKPIIVNDSFPKDAHHGWKFIAFGPDGYLYVPVGAPCNICELEDQRYASIMRMKADGSNLEVFAKGVRNSVGFDWHPITNELWFTDNGRDWLGDDSPPDELNKAPQKGMHFGYPYCHGGTIADPQFGKKYPCDSFTPPVANLGPHVAALGMRFYDKKAFPKQYQGNIFIAEHGSWNRTSKIGYRITTVNPDENPQKSYQVFAQGWLQGEEVHGRPADVLVMPDGALLVSDDYAGLIYRIYYDG